MDIREMPLLLAVLFLLVSCTPAQLPQESNDDSIAQTTAATTVSSTAETTITTESTVTSDRIPSSTSQTLTTSADAVSVGSLDNIPPYAGAPYCVLNNDRPYFTDEDWTTDSFEYYSPLDALGRCGVCYACIGQDIMPTEDRKSISSVKPAGWHLSRYDDIVEGGYLYNRCHLIAFELAGENANEQNLITGTRYMNVQGMLPFENQVADYVKETNHHVLYRVTPHYQGDDLLADGVQMEAYSVEDAGSGICFHIFAYNVQPQITIDYATGDNWLAEVTVTTAPVQTTITETTTTEQAEIHDYVLNRNSKVFHLPDCAVVEDMAEKNAIYFTGTREEVIEQGYHPCQRCNP